MQSVDVLVSEDCQFDHSNLVFASEKSLQFVGVSENHLTAFVWLTLVSSSITLTPLSVVLLNVRPQFFGNLTSGLRGFSNNVCKRAGGVNLHVNGSNHNQTHLTSGDNCFPREVNE